MYIRCYVGWLEMNDKSRFDMSLSIQERQIKFVSFPHTPQKKLGHISQEMWLLFFPLANFSFSLYSFIDMKIQKSKDQLKEYRGITPFVLG